VAAVGAAGHLPRPRRAGVRDATAIAEAVRAREVSAAELAQEALDRAAADDLGAVWLITEERARREADAVDALVALGDDPGPLAGVPVGWKDLIDTSGIRTTYGSEIYRDHVPARDADVVSLLAGGGAVCIAKLNTHELAWGTTSDNPWFGTCRNPHDPSRMPGGSSGGSGAAVASGIVALAPGTDTGGSIRCPSSVCGIVGLKPTFGRVSLAGIHPLYPSLDHCGPMVRSVRDAALALEVMAGPSPRDPRTQPMAVPAYRDALGAGVEGRTTWAGRPARRTRPTSASTWPRRPVPSTSTGRNAARSWGVTSSASRTARTGCRCGRPAARCSAGSPTRSGCSR